MIYDPEKKHVHCTSRCTLRKLTSTRARLPATVICPACCTVALWVRYSPISYVNHQNGHRGCRHCSSTPPAYCLPVIGLHCVFRFAPWTVLVSVSCFCSLCFSFFHHCLSVCTLVTHTTCMQVCNIPSGRRKVRHHDGLVRVQPETVSHHGHRCPKTLGRGRNHAVLQRLRPLPHSCCPC